MARGSKLFLTCSYYDCEVRQANDYQNTLVIESMGILVDNRDSRPSCYSLACVTIRKRYAFIAIRYG